ncbi:hypothetical protein GYA49_00920 [Candidatus Beckwithbacteria bacterium]|nr:hypothetical protein [Candidatus Beckwithbacteria bacterium]
MNNKKIKRNKKKKQFFSKVVIDNLKTLLIIVVGFNLLFLPIFFLRLKSVSRTPDIYSAETSNVQAFFQLQINNPPKDIGEEFDVLIRLNTCGAGICANSTAADILVGFDSTKLQVLSISQGNLYDTYFKKDINNDSFYIAAFNVPPKKYAGDGVFATVRFKTLSFIDETKLYILESGTSSDQSSVYFENSTEDGLNQNLLSNKGDVLISIPTPKPTSTSTPTPTSTPLLTSENVYLAKKGVISKPFYLARNGYISQNKETPVPLNGGKAIYTFSINEADAGYYLVKILVKAVNEASNSLFINFDQEPTSPEMIWDINTNSKAIEQYVSWRGNGTSTNNQFTPKSFKLNAGTHTLIIRGRESNTGFAKITLVKQNF